MNAVEFPRWLRVGPPTMPRVHRPPFLCLLLWLCALWVPGLACAVQGADRAALLLDEIGRAHV